MESCEIKEFEGATAQMLKDLRNTDEEHKGEENQPDLKVIWVGIKCLLWFWQLYQ